jgi:UDP-N-acetyl-D-mannosaminuronic acid dehydrogenase
LAEGKALEELEILPQIIGADDNNSFNKAKEIFEKTGVDIIRTSMIEAELMKLFCNVSRYMQFSVVNYLAMIASQFNCDIHKLLNIINEKYPRPIYGTVGLCSGTCLRKDWGMLNETIPYPDMLLSAYKINEFMPKFLIDKTKEFEDIKGKRVGILGETFKKDSDDTRDSLIPKFVRYLEREVPSKIHIHDPNLEDTTCLSEFIHEIDILYILVNHTEFEKNFNIIKTSLKANCLIVDLWNVSKKNRIFYRKVG